MREAIEKAVNRFAKSAFGAGAMHRVFICVGPPEWKKPMKELLSARDFEVIDSPANAVGLFSTEFLQHQGSHFNKKLFFQDGWDTLVEKMGDELFRRLEFQRRQLTRTATWSLIWIDSFEVADKFRKLSPGIWFYADDDAVFLDGNLLDEMEIGEPTAQVEVQSSLGKFPIPKDTGTQFWKEVFELRTNDALISFATQVIRNEEISPEALFAVARFCGLLELRDFANRAKLWLQEFQFSDLHPSPAEILLQRADQLASKGKVSEALDELNLQLEPWLQEKKYLQADRPLRFRALLKQAMGRISEAASDIDRWEEIARKSDLDPAIASALDARAHHVESLGDKAQAENLRSEAQKLINI